MEHLLTTYIRTKHVFKHRLKDLPSYDTVKITIQELNKLGFNNGPLLYDLRRRGEIWYDNKGNFKAIKQGKIDPELLKITQKNISVPLDSLHMYMMEQLKFISLPKNVDFETFPVYFKAFLTQRHKSLRSFFNVDSFSNRVHTPVCNLKQNLRGKILLNKQKIVSLDVKQMQPLVLSKILYDVIGDNGFSDAIMRGVDVYNLILQQRSDLDERSQAKKVLFQLIFGKPMEGISDLFEGDKKWIDWINLYKSKVEPRNPHHFLKHTNLAWLLQYSEVKVMTQIWSLLKEKGISFLTIHDDVLCTKKDKNIVLDIMHKILKSNFTTYEINITEY